MLFSAYVRPLCCPVVCDQHSLYGFAVRGITSIDYAEEGSTVVVEAQVKPLVGVDTHSL